MERNFRNRVPSKSTQGGNPFARIRDGGRGRGRGGGGGGGGVDWNTSSSSGFSSSGSGRGDYSRGRGGRGGHGCGRGRGGRGRGGRGRGGIGGGDDGEHMMTDSSPLAAAGIGAAETDGSNSFSSSTFPASTSDSSDQQHGGTDMGTQDGSSSRFVLEITGFRPHATVEDSLKQWLEERSFVRPHFLEFHLPRRGTKCTVVVGSKRESLALSKLSGNKFHGSTLVVKYIPSSSSSSSSHSSSSSSPGSSSSADVGRLNTLLLSLISDTYVVAERFLNLDQLAGRIPVKIDLNTSPHCIALFSLMKEKCPDCASLSLRNNNLRNLYGFTQLGSMLPGLIRLNLADNNLASFKQLDYLQKIPLTELSLANNPLSVNSSYRIEVQRRFPKVKILDGVQVEPLISFNIPAITESNCMPTVLPNFFDTQQTMTIAQNFLTQFISMYDSVNRSSLIGGYAESAFFSLSTTLTADDDNFLRGAAESAGGAGRTGNNNLQNVASGGGSGRGGRGGGGGGGEGGGGRGRGGDFSRSSHAESPSTAVSSIAEHQSIQGYVRINHNLLSVMESEPRRSCLFQGRMAIGNVFSKLPVTRTILDNGSVDTFVIGGTYLVCRVSGYFWETLSSVVRPFSRTFLLVPMPSSPPGNDGSQGGMLIINDQLFVRGQCGPVSDSNAALFPPTAFNNNILGGSGLGSSFFQASNMNQSSSPFLVGPGVVPPSPSPSPSSTPLVSPPAVFSSFPGLLSSSVSTTTPSFNLSSSSSIVAPAPMPTPIPTPTPTPTLSSTASTDSIPIRVPSSPESLSEAAKENLLKKLQFVTGLKPSYCLDCLEANEWNYDRAMQNFLQLKKEGVIPPEVFE